MLNDNQHDIFDVFLSHAHADAEAVETLGARLEDEAQLRVWLDRWVLIPGEHWQQKMSNDDMDSSLFNGVIMHQKFFNEVKRSPK